MMIIGTLTLIGVVTVPLVIFKKWKALGIFLIVVCGIGLAPTLVDLFWYDVPLSAELGRIAIIASTFVGSGVAFTRTTERKK
mgnify:CR=1 FL=1